MKSPDQIIKQFCVSEKATALSAELNKYSFVVDKRVNRTEVAEAVSKVFNVKVTKVNIFNKKGAVVKSRTSRKSRPGKKPDQKKAIVSLAKGDKIEII